MSTDRIPQEALDAAHRKLCRMVASVIIRAMAEADVSFAQMDERLGKPLGFSKAYVNKLVNPSPKLKELREISDLATALDAEIVFGMEAYPYKHGDLFTSGGRDD